MIEITRKVICDWCKAERHLKSGEIAALGWVVHEMRAVGTTTFIKEDLCPGCADKLERARREA